jgi:hypothetical protein
MSSNYPPGTGPNDPKAPWCQPDVEYAECDECDGKGVIPYAPDVGEVEYEKCDLCDGSGKIEVDPNEDEPDWEEE